MWNSLSSMYWKIIKIYTKQTIALLIRFFEDTYELQFVDNFFLKKKNGACVFLSTVFFLSLLAGKFTAFERVCLQNK